MVECMAATRVSGRRLIAAPRTVAQKETGQLTDSQQHQRRKAIFFAYEMGLSVKDIADALNVSRGETLRILREDRWMYEGLTRVREYNRQLFAKNPQLHRTSKTAKRAVRIRHKGRRR
jgi:DNA invertase Pin-like site-specific DNA recombinase